MFSTAIKKFGAAVAVATLTLVGWSGSAQALQVVGRWDPLYGAPFADLGWRGEATFEVNGCFFTLGTGTYNNGFCGGGGSIFVVSASVEFYDDSDDSFKGSLDWTSPSVPNVSQITLGPGGIVTGVKTHLFDWQFGPSSFEGINNYEFALKFTGDSVALKYRICEEDDEEEEDEYKSKSKSSFVSSYSSGGGYSDCQTGFNKNRPQNLTFTTYAVPEPQTPLLILSALGALGIAVRRRRRS